MYCAVNSANRGAIGYFYFYFSYHVLAAGDGGGGGGAQSNEILQVQRPSVANPDPPDPIQK